MKLTIQTKEFKNKLSQLSGVVENKSAIPALSCVKLETNAEGSGYTLTANDVSTSKSVPLVAEGSGDFDFFTAVLLPVKLRQVLSKLTTEKVTLDFEGTTIAVEAGAFKADIETLPVEHFPATPEPATEFRTLDLKALQKLIKRTKFAVPENEGKFVIAASLFQSTGKLLTAIATDGTRLAHAMAEGDFPQFNEMVLPTTAQNLLEGLDGDTVKIAESEASFFFENENAKIYVRKTPSKFPDLTHVLQTKPVGSVKFAAGSLAAAVERARMIADDDRPTSTFVIADNLVLETKSGSGKSKEGVAIQGTIKHPPFTLNLDYLAEFINQVEGEVVLHLQGQGQVTDFRAGGDYRYLLMPFAK